MQSEIYWLALQRHFFYSPQLGLQLLNAFDTPQKIFEVDRPSIEKILGAKGKEWHEKLAQTPWPQIEKEWDELQKNSARLIPWGHSDYPHLLQQINDPPVVLIAKGNTATLNERPWIAMVGARKATPYGRKMAYQIAKQLAEHQIGVVSGLAYGIDSCVHEGALAGGGITWGVMGTGIDQIYPASHRKLANALLATGGVLTEFPIGTEPKPHHFPQRNRIVSGMSLGVVVIEAAVDSGSLITARLALEQNREVFAVPGAVGHPNVQGTHQLIRDGAKLIEGAWDIVAELPQLQHASDPSETASSKEKVLGVLTKAPKSADQLAYEAGVSIEKILVELTTLECEGKIRRISGAKFAAKV